MKMSTLMVCAMLCVSTPAEAQKKSLPDDWRFVCDASTQSVPRTCFVASEPLIATRGDGSPSMLLFFNIHSLGGAEKVFRIFVSRTDVAHIRLIFRALDGELYMLSPALSKGECEITDKGCLASFEMHDEMLAELSSAKSLGVVIDLHGSGSSKDAWWLIDALTLANLKSSLEKLYRHIALTVHK